MRPSSGVQATDNALAQRAKPYEHPMHTAAHATLSTHHGPAV